MPVQSTTRSCMQCPLDKRVRDSASEKSRRCFGCVSTPRDEDTTSSIQITDYGREYRAVNVRADAIVATREAVQFARVSAPQLYENLPRFLCDTLVYEFTARLSSTSTTPVFVKAAEFEPSPRGPGGQNAAMPRTYLRLCLGFLLKIVLAFVSGFADLVSTEAGVAV